MKTIKVSGKGSKPLPIPVVRKGLFPGNRQQGWVKTNGIYHPRGNIVTYFKGVDHGSINRIQN